jgi:cephalosporin-C deacetylase-like acetyl esterase
MREINNDLLHERLLKNEPILKFDENADFEEWKKALKAKFLELLGMEEIAKNACDINIEIEEEVRQDGYIRYRYVFESEKDCLLPCYLLIPDTGKEKYPVLICLQGHSGGFHVSIGEKRFASDENCKSFDTSTFALEGVKNGYAALCIEQRGMGERQTLRWDRGRVEGEGCPCYFTAFTALLVGRTLLGERVWDISRVLDAVLEHFDIVDETNIY